MKSKIIWNPLLILSLVALTSTPASAGLVYGTTVFGSLIGFDSSSPGTITTSVPISGLTDQFESIAGIDFRPANGQLYALGNAPGSIYRLYTVNLATGQATRVGSTDLTFGGTFWGFDFNPVVDRIRVVNDAGLNIRLNPNDGTLAGTDTTLNPLGNVVAAAYDRNDTNVATSTTLFGIDTGSNQLVRIGGVDGVPSPDGGSVTIIGALGVDPTGFSSFDIADSGVAYAALNIDNNDPLQANLYTIDLATGVASLVGLIGDGTTGVTGISAAPTAIPEPTTATFVGFCGLVFSLLRRRR